MVAHDLFLKDAEQSFDFLVRDFGYKCIMPPGKSTLEGLRFEKPPVYVETGWYKGEVDVTIGVTVDTTILRPYRTKRFPLWHVACHIDPAVKNESLPIKSFVTTNADAKLVLDHYAKMMKRLCGDILRGDLAILESIVASDHPVK